MIVLRRFRGSQAAFSRACGLDVADTSRVLTGVRPVTLEIVARVAKSIAPAAAARLAEAFFSDLIAALPQRCSVIVRPKPSSARTTEGRVGTRNLDR
jgi:hypothetical protein